MKYTNLQISMFDEEDFDVLATAAMSHLEHNIRMKNQFFKHIEKKKKLEQIILC
jgi:hypothetical protein